jgi:hypothetical protein
VVAVLDTSVLVRAWLSRTAAPNSARRVLLLAGLVYDSFTSPAIIEAAEEVLVRPRFAARRADVRRWFDAYLRASRQVFPETVPLADVRAAARAFPAATSMVGSSPPHVRLPTCSNAAVRP